MRELPLWLGIWWHRRIRKHKQLVWLYIATILGLPLGRLVGWHFLQSALALVVMVFIMRLLPNLPSKKCRLVI